MIIPCEKREGRIEMETIGGAELTTPAQARVMMLYSFPERPQEINAAGIGPKSS
jgi:hypothetical protein